jgi:hypothetical protein
MADIKELEELLGEVNDSIEEMRNKKIKITAKDLPSNIELMLPGIPAVKSLNFLFSGKLDQLLDTLFNLIISGDFEKIVKSEEDLKDFLKSTGIGTGSFEGPVSRAVITSIQSSINSAKFAKLEDKAKQAVLISKNLKKNRKNIKDKEQLKKYNEAVFAIESVVKLFAKIYKNRKFIHNKIYKGLYNVVNENLDNTVVEPLY